MVLDLFQKFLITMLVFVPLEQLLPRNREKKILRKHWLTDTAYALLASIVTALGSLLVVVIGWTLLDFIISDSFRESVSDQHLVLQIIEIIILADIGYYWIHRKFHEIPALWRIHAIHHSIEEMDWLAAHRVHPIDQILTRGVSLILPFSLGFDSAALAVFAAIFGWHSMLKHSNVNVTFGPLRWLLATPTYHHWHHANEKHAFDKNYAGQLPLLDVLFGTALMEEKHGPKIYGTDTPVSDSFVDQLVDPFKKQTQNSALVEPNEFPA